jgi:hypothetical protein
VSAHWKGADICCARPSWILADAIKTVKSLCDVEGYRYDCESRIMRNQREVAGKSLAFPISPEKTHRRRFSSKTSERIFRLLLLHLSE